MASGMEKVVFNGVFERLRKDREGEVKITFTIPLSDEDKARQVPIQKELTIAVLYDEDTTGNIRGEQDTGL